MDLTRRKHNARPLLYSFVLITLLLCSPAAWAQKRHIYGVVMDSLTDQRLENVSVTLGDGRTSAMTDADGIFELAIPTSAKFLNISRIGYEPKQLPVNRNSLDLYSVYLTPKVQELGELTVKRSRYSKHNNPAVDFVRRLKEQGKQQDPRQNPYYSYRKYRRLTLALSDISTDSASKLMKSMPFLHEQVDTSLISGQPVVDVVLRETMSNVHHRAKPNASVDLIEATNAQGIDKLIANDNTQAFYDDVLRDVDLFDDNINLIQQRFVSPLSPLGPDFYRYYLTDTVPVNGVDCATLAFYPKVKGSHGFNGHIYVPVGDSTMSIRRVTLSVPPQININLLKNMMITQEYTPGPNGERIKTLDDMAVQFNAVKGAPGVYARKITMLTDHSFAPVDDSQFEAVNLSLGAMARDSLYWASARPVAMGSAEAKVAMMLNNLRRKPWWRYGEPVFKALVTGYIPTGEPSYWDFGQVNTFLSFNDVEGARLRVGGLTTANLSKRLLGRAYTAYGTKDRKFKYGATLEYSFLDKEYHAREFPVQAIRLNYNYDIDEPGVRYLYTNPDNIFLSLRRMSDTRVNYVRKAELSWINERRNNFSSTLTVTHERREATRWLPFVLADGTNLPFFDMSKVSLTLRYAPGEKFFQNKTTRYPINLDAPVFTLTHEQAFKGVAGSRFDLCRTEFSAGKRVHLSAFGWIDGLVKGGIIWSSSPYTSLFIPNVNLSYTIQPESFALMNPMEFVSDRYVQWDFTYWGGGILFDRLPWIKRFKLREAVSCRGMYGWLTDRNKPWLHPELPIFPQDARMGGMGRDPYIEVSAGVDNIFRCLRLDYAWRVTYRNPGYPIDRSGLRLALHFSF